MATLRPRVVVLAVGWMIAIMLIALAVPAHLQAQTPPPGYNKLQDIYVFKDALKGTWSGGDLVAPGSNVPIDTTQMYNGLPSLSYEIQGPSQWWWVSILAGQDWRTYSLEFYYPEGFLEFNVKGAAGGEQFNIAIIDLESERNPNSVQYTISSRNFFTVTTDWQSVKIPLTAFVSSGQPFRFRQMRQVNLSESYSGPYAKHFWINSLRFTSPNNEHNYPAIKVDQVGYVPFGEKYAIVSGFGEVLSANAGTPFQVRRVADGVPVYSGNLSLVTDYDTVSGERVLEADFTDLFVPGAYYLTVDAPGIDPSPAFDVAFRVYRPLLRDTVRFYYHQRQGIAITEPYAEGFARGAGHPNDITAKFRSSGVIHDVSHGWYDAGDFGKYTPFAAGVIVDLLDAYATFPFAFPDNHLNIPESGNGKPDILDEVKWELDWLVKMQDPESGGFYHLVYPNNCPSSGACQVENITEQRYIEDFMGGVGNVRPTASTAKAVAALARAAGIYRSYDSTLAQSYRTAAEKGWAYLLANPNNIPATGFNGEQSTDDQERLWAAAELFRATGQPQYGRYFLDRYQNYESIWTRTDGNAGDVAMRAFLAYNGSLAANLKERAWFRTRFRTWRETQLARLQGPWRNFQPYWGYYWGNNAVTLQTVIVLTLGDLTTGTFYDPEVLNAAREQLHYILGVNPLRHSFVSGHGADSVQTLFSQLYGGYGLYSPPPGYLPGGPDIYDSPLYSRFAAKCYADTNTDWPPSEPAIYYNAYLVFVTALVDQTAILPAH
jgi:endoglucanase